MGSKENLRISGRMSDVVGDSAGKRLRGMEVDMTAAHTHRHLYRLPVVRVGFEQWLFLGSMSSYDRRVWVRQSDRAS